jgi:hypothetical protein
MCLDGAHSADRHLPEARFWIVSRTPRCKRISFKVATTSSPFSLCPTAMARLSRVNTSRIVKARNRRPSANCQPRNPDSTLRWEKLAGNARGDAARPAGSAVAYVAVSGPLLCTGGTQASSPRSSLPASTTLGFCGSHSAPAPARSLESVVATPSSVPVGSHSETSRLESAPHGMHAARSPGRYRADSSPPGGAARASEFFCLCRHIWSWVFAAQLIRSDCEREGN